MLALNVVEPQNSGIGGGLFWVRHDGQAARSKRSTAAKPRRRRRRRTGSSAPTASRCRFAQAFVGGRSAGVPGAVAAMAEAHRAPRQAGLGAAVRAGDPARARRFRRDAAAAQRAHRSPGATSPARRKGRLPARRRAAGDRRHAAPARARRHAREARAARPRRVLHGRQSASRSPRRSIARCRQPLDMTAADIERYRAKERPPVCGTYRHYRICGMGPPSSGAITVLMILKQLERFDMAGARARFAGRLAPARRIASASPTPTATPTSPIPPSSAFRSPGCSTRPTSPGARR